MIVDLNLADKEVLVVGGGSVGERKTCKLLQEKCILTVASKDFTPKVKRLGQEGKAKLIRVDVEDDLSSIDSLIPNSSIVIAATTNQRLNEKIAALARKAGTLVCVVDGLHSSDFSMPAIANVGGIQIAVYTGGRSPAMARILRKRIEKMITQEDILQVELQEHARSLAKSHVSNKSQRRKALYQIIRNREVRSLLRRGAFEEAKICAGRIIGCN